MDSDRPVIIDLKTAEANLLLDSGKKDGLHSLPRNQRVDLTFEDLFYNVPTSRRKKGKWRLDDVVPT